MGPVVATDSAPPGAAGGQKALGVKVNVTKTPQTYLLGVIRPIGHGRSTPATAVAGQPPAGPGGALLPIG